MHRESIKVIIAIAILLLEIVLPIHAQSGNSSYFLSGSFDRYKLNPALTPERAFVALPCIGGLGLHSDLNVGLSNFIYDSKSKPGNLTTFMSGDVSRDEFLDALPDVSEMNLDLDAELLAFGFGGKKWFAWFDASWKSQTSLNIPKDMFAFMKSALSANDYEIRDLTANEISYGKASLGFQYRPIDNLSVGVSVNVLFGLAYARFGIDRMNAHMGADNWSILADASARYSIPGVSLVLDDNGKISDIETDFDNLSFPENYGLAFDFGAEYDFGNLVPGMKLSASVTDLGYIDWKDVNVIATDNTRAVSFEGYKDEDTFDEIADDAEKMLDFQDNGTEEMRTSLDAAIRFGIEYTVPSAKWLSFGELLTSRFGTVRYTESRTSLTMRAGKWLEFSIDAAFSSHGTSFGGILNFHPAGINLFLAGELESLELNPQFIPMDGYSASLALGVRFGLSGRRF